MTRKMPSAESIMNAFKVQPTCYVFFVSVLPSVLPSVIIGSLKGSLVPFLLSCCRVCCLGAFSCVLKRKASVWGINSWKREHGNFDNAPLIKCNLRVGIVQLGETFLCVWDEMVLSSSNALKKLKYFSCLTNHSDVLCLFHICHPSWCQWVLHMHIRGSIQTKIYYCEE